MAQINIFDILKGYYSTEDFKTMFRNSLYKNYSIILLGAMEFGKYDSTQTYKKDDVVYTYRLGNYQVYVSLIDNNNEPLNNTNAWENTENTIITEEEQNALINMCWDIIPANLQDLYIDSEDHTALSKLKYIIGLFVACYIANKNSVFDGGEGGKQVTHKSIDGMSVSYQIPDYVLNQNNLFYSGNPYGMELLSLYRKLFINRVVDTGENIFIAENWSHNKEYKW